MNIKLLIDECLTPELVNIAINAGFIESTCLRDRGWLQLKDWELMNKLIDGDFTLVTHNSKDFRGQGKSHPGGLHAKANLHAGLVCLGSALPMSLSRQHRLFAVAVGELKCLPDLVNMALEIYEHADGSISIEVYDIP